MTRQEHLKQMEEVFQRMLAIAVAKNNDYCGSEVDADPFKNFKLVETLGITSTERGIIVRICDKIARISSLIEKEGGQVKDESLEDTILDAANYLVILRNYLQNKRKNV